MLEAKKSHINIKQKTYHENYTSKIIHANSKKKRQNVDLELQIAQYNSQYNKVQHQSSLHCYTVGEVTNNEK